jgi:hypothetical protein
MYVCVCVCAFPSLSCTPISAQIIRLNVIIGGLIELKDKKGGQKQFSDWTGEKKKK